MGTSKRYADQIDAIHLAKMKAVAEREAPDRVRPPVYLGDAKWILVRNNRTAAMVEQTEPMGFTAEKYMVVHRHDGTLVGYYTTLEKADRAID